MSILSKMCSRFRKTAEELREKFTLVGFNGDSDLDPTIFKAATQLEEAAFAIDGLRIRCDELWDLSMSLRKLVEDIQRFHECGKDCTECPLFDQCSESNGTNGCIGDAIIHDRMRELGIEVRQCH